MKTTAAPDSNDPKPANDARVDGEPSGATRSGEMAVEPGPLDAERTRRGRVAAWMRRSVDALWPPRAAAHFAPMSPATREVVRALLGRAASEREAAESLADVGDAAESLALIRRAAETTRAALAPIDVAVLSAEGRRSVARANAELAELAELPDPFDRAAAAPLPVDLDFESHRRVLRRHHRALRALTWGSLEVRRVARERILGALAVVAFAVAAVALVVRIQRAPKVIASAIYAAGFPASAAIDGDPDSEWLLPDGSLGWIDVHIRPQRLVRRIRLVNALNAPFYDRGTGKFTIEAFRDGAKVAVIEGSFDPNDPPGTQGMRDVEIGRPVDRIRILVGSYLRSGGGLAGWGSHRERRRRHAARLIRGAGMPSVSSIA
jgi:hypothetical protein